MIDVLTPEQKQRILAARERNRSGAERHVFELYLKCQQVYSIIIHSVERLVRRAS